MSAKENIETQEALQTQMRRRVKATGYGLVAHRLGITVADLKNRMDFFGDFTLTELRYLAIATGTTITYKVAKHNSPDDSADEFALTR